LALQRGLGLEPILIGCKTGCFGRPLLEDGDGLGQRSDLVVPVDFGNLGRRIALGQAMGGVGKP
jgi:hypothetical protein